MYSSMMSCDIVGTSSYDRGEQRSTEAEQTIILLQTTWKTTITTTPHRDHFAAFTILNSNSKFQLIAIFSSSGIFPEDGYRPKIWNLSLNTQRKGSRCGGDGSVTVKCSVLQWSWQTLMNRHGRRTTYNLYTHTLVLAR